MAEHLRIRKNGHMYSQRLTRNEANGYFAPAIRAVRLDPTTGEQGVRQDQGRSTIAGKAADRELEWSWYKPASAGFLLPAIFAVSSHIASRLFLAPDFPPFKGPFEAEPVRYSERLTRAGGTWLFPTWLALRSIGSIKG